MLLSNRSSYHWKCSDIRKAERFRENILKSDHTWETHSRIGGKSGSFYTCKKCSLFIDSCEMDGYYWDEDIQGWRRVSSDGIPLCSELCMKMALE